MPSAYPVNTRPLYHRKNDKFGNERDRELEWHMTHDDEYVSWEEMRESGVKEVL